MKVSSKLLNTVYDRTSGYCHICGKKLSFCNYGAVGAKAAWEIEHSNPKSRGGTDRLCNLYAACITCNRIKGTVTTRTARAWYGRTCAPPSFVARSARRGHDAFALMQFSYPVGVFPTRHSWPGVNFRPPRKRRNRW